jgi:hypothetical protein
MSLKEELAQEMEGTRRDFHHLLDSVPEALYDHPSDNPAWTVGDVLYHITLGPPALRFEIWMIRRTGWLYQAMLNDLTSSIFNRVNASFARRPKRITRHSLIGAYESGHKGMMSGLERIREDELRKSIIYPKSFIAELAGEVSIERLYRYVREHFEIHSEQILKALEEYNGQTDTD